MGITTWLERITDETNVWFSAIKAEEGGRDLAAARHYLVDATACVEKGSTVRAALSSYCAADCMARAGWREEAKALFLEAGVMYNEASDASLGESIRESIWALQRAYACFVQAEDVSEAERVRGELSVLARRANPFVTGSEAFGVPLPKAMTLPSSGRRPSPSDDKELREALDRFMVLRRRAKGARSTDREVRWRNEPFDQESFVSQLG